MAETKIKPKEKKAEKTEKLEEKAHVAPAKQEEQKHEHKHSDSTEKPPETKPEAKAEKETPKPSKKEPEKQKKRYIAEVNVRSIHMSKKQAMYICNFIKGKKIDQAMADLERVTKFKLIVPFKGEIPHRKGKGMMSGRYPIKSAQQFITILKGLKGNAIVNQMDLDRTRIFRGIPNWAPEPARRGGRHAKRIHLTIKAREIPQGAKK
jgi:ribosomal protein L22